MTSDDHPWPPAGLFAPDPPDPMSVSLRILKNQLLMLRSLIVLLEASRLSIASGPLIGKLEEAGDETNALVKRLE